jgi:hypothetical protein
MRYNKTKQRANYVYHDSICFPLLITSFSELQNKYLTYWLCSKNSELLSHEHQKQTTDNKHKVPVKSKHAGGIIMTKK